MFRDRYDLELSSASREACEAFTAGIDAALQLDHPGISELREAVTLDPEFAMAHAALARQLQIHGFRTEVGKHLDRASDLKRGATKREQSAIEVIAAAVTFQGNALSRARAHMTRNPRDIFVFSHLVGPFGLLAFSAQSDWREENVTLLKEYSGHYPSDDWWVLSTRSFMAAETGDTVSARQFGEQAWQRSNNGNCAHSLAHVHFEESAVDEGIEFLNDWADSTRTGSDMRHHLFWHLALLLRERGAGPSELLAIYETELDPRISDPMPLSTFSDNAALLWRCKLSGLDVPDSICTDLADYADKHYPARGFAFADLHKIMSTALLNDDVAQRSLLDELTSITRNNESQLANVVLKIAMGFSAYANGDFVKAIDCLEPVLDDSVLLGGSNPQRSVIAETYRSALGARN